MKRFIKHPLTKTLAVVVFICVAFMGLRLIASNTQYNGLHWPKQGIVRYAWVYGGTVAVNSWVVHKADSIPICALYAHTTGVDSPAVVDTVGWGALFKVGVTIEVSGATGGETTEVTGLDSAGNVQVDSIIIAGTNTFVLSTKYWSRVTSVRSWSSTAADTGQIVGYLMEAVYTTTTAKDPKVAGVMRLATATKSWGPVQYRGRGLALVNASGTAIRNGSILSTTNSAGKAVVLAADSLDTPGATCGKALEAATTDGTFLVEINAGGF